MTNMASETEISGVQDLRGHLTSPTTRAALHIEHCLLTSVRQHLTEQGFTELLPPIIGPVTDPGIRGSKQVDVDFYGNRYRIMTSAILYKQASLLAFGKLFCIAPNVRLEPLETARTSRHLAEFHQIDVEIAGAAREDAMAVAEGIVRTAVGEVVKFCGDELAQLGRDTEKLSRMMSAAFDMITHSDAVRQLTDMGHSQDHRAEINWQGEEELSSRAERPFFIIDYPKGSRGFYDLEDVDRMGVLRNFDLIAPEGFGELASGGEREHHYANIITRMRETGENPSKYAWFLELARAGLPSSSGFGIGVERLIRYIAGFEAVWQTCAFPKVPGVVSA